MPTSRAKSTWRWRWLRAVMALLIAVSAFAAAGWFLMVPALMHQRIDALLREIEPTHRAFTVQSIGLDGLQITDIELGGQPWLHVSRVDVGWSLGSLREGKALSMAVTDPVWRLSRHDGELQLGFSVAGGPRAPGPLGLPVDAIEIRDGRIEFDDAGTMIATDISASALRETGGMMRGRFATGTIAIDGNAPLPSIDGTLSFDGRRLIADVAWPVTSDAIATAMVDLNIADGPITGEVSAQVPPVSLAALQSLIPLAPGFADVAVSGRVDAEMHWMRDDSGVRQTLKIHATDVGLARDDWPLAVNSASATILFDSLSPLRTQGGQLLTINSATTGELEIRDAAAEFEVTSLDDIYVHSMRWSIVDGGTFRTSPFRFDPRVPVVVTTIDCEGVDLHRWLTLFTDGRADGEGELAGRFSIAWDPRVYPRLRFLDGLLAAQPQPGWIKTSDSAALANLLDEANPDFAIDARLAEVKTKIVDALGDFGYTSLRLQFVPNADDAILRAELKGKGRRGENPVEFESLTINLHNFAATLQDVLDLQSAMNRWKHRK